jgi:hypothetical protein
MKNLSLSHHRIQRLGRETMFHYEAAANFAQPLDKGK